MRLRYFSMGKVATRIWLFLILASAAVPVMHILFPYIDTTNYYHIEAQLQQIMQQQNQSAEQAKQLGEALSGDESLKDKFAAFLTLTPIGLAIRMFLMMLEGMATGLYPVWAMLGFDKLKTANGVSLASILTTMVYLFYTWTIINLVTGRDE